MEAIRLDVTTDASGDASTTASIQAGLLYAVRLIDGDLADGVDVTLTCETTELSIPLLTKANFNTDLIAYPRALEQLVTDGSDLTTHALPIVEGKLKVVIAQGGNAKSGAVICYLV